MTSWTARIDALLDRKLDMSFANDKDCREWFAARLALASERLREPHDVLCNIGMACDEDGTVAPCTCGKDSDLLHILEGR